MNRPWRADKFEARAAASLEGAATAAWADGGGHILLEGCRVGTGSEGVVREMGGGRVLLEACVADDVREA